MGAFLDNGVFDLLGMQYGLHNGFRIKEGQLMPIAYVVSASEPEFGCEGRPDGREVYGILNTYTITGLEKCQIEEKLFNESGIFDHMWVGTLTCKDGTEKFGCWREGSDEFHAFPKSTWDARIVRNN